MRCPRCGKYFEEGIEKCDNCKYQFSMKSDNGNDSNNINRVYDITKPIIIRKKYPEVGLFGFIIGCLIVFYFVFHEMDRMDIEMYFIHTFKMKYSLLDILSPMIFKFPLIELPILFMFIYWILNKTVFKKKWIEYEESLKRYNKLLIEKKNEETKNMDKYRTENKISSNAKVVKCLKSKLLNITDPNELLVWSDSDNLYFIGKHYCMRIRKLQIPKSEINTFLRTGDIHNEVNVSGGKIEGGGSSIGGAIVGSVIAGSTGAIIGSRKPIKMEEIKTENITIDNRETILEFRYNDNIEHMFFDSDAYNVLLQIIPSKEVQLVNQRKVNEVDKNSTDDIVVKQIKQLSELKDQGILTEEEFENKKKLLLDKIK